jgi:hypothetical protein
MLRDRAVFVRDAGLCVGAYLVLTAGIFYVNDRWLGHRSSDVPWIGYFLFWSVMWAPAPVVAIAAAAAYPVRGNLRLPLYLIVMAATVSVMEALALSGVHLYGIAIGLTLVCMSTVLVFRLIAESRDV